MSVQSLSRGFEAHFHLPTGSSKHSMPLPKRDASPPYICGRQYANRQCSVHQKGRLVAVYEVQFGCSQQ